MIKLSTALRKKALPLILMYSIASILRRLTVPLMVLTRTFNWNLSGVAHGVYDIKANATLEGDTYLDNNEVIVYDAVKVKMEGDVDGNNYVGSWDLILLADAYGSDPGEPNWNRQADFNDDDYVGPYDFWMLAGNYGMST